MPDNRFLLPGVAAMVAAVVCCAAPAVLVLAGATGLSALLDLLGYALAPMAALLVALAFYTGLRVWRSRRRLRDRRAPVTESIR